MTLICSECFNHMPSWDNGKTKCPICGAVYLYKQNIDPHCCSFNMRLISRKRMRKLFMSTINCSFRRRYKA